MAVNAVHVHGIISAIPHQPRIGPAQLSWLHPTVGWANARRMHNDRACCELQTSLTVISARRDVVPMMRSQLWLFWTMSLMGAAATGLVERWLCAAAPAVDATIVVKSVASHECAGRFGGCNVRCYLDCRLNVRVIPWRQTRPGVDECCSAA